MLIAKVKKKKLSIFILKLFIYNVVFVVLWGSFEITTSINVNGQYYIYFLADSITYEQKNTSNYFHEDILEYNFMLYPRLSF